MRIIYSAFFYLAIPFILLRLLWRAIKSPAYSKRWAERFALSAPISTSSTQLLKAQTTKKIIWIHTVSVGEFIAALPLIRRLQTNSKLQLLITTTTPTGSERVTQTLGDAVWHVYAPYDLPDVVARFIRRFNPSLLLIMETELWPNWIAACKARSIPSILMNARMSEKSARGYQKFSALTRPMLSQLSLCLVQNSKDAERLNQLGLPEANTKVTGNIKFDLNLSNEIKNSASDIKKSLSKIPGKRNHRTIWVAASTHAGEDEIIFSAHAELLKQKDFADLLLIVVPRHPERFSSVFDLAKSASFNVIRRSEQKAEKYSTEEILSAQVMVGDTMGELLSLYGVSDIAFVGGSLVPNGGHNLIEPAAWGLPLLSGPHLFNFSEVSRLMLEAKALSIANNAKELKAELTRLLSEKKEIEIQGSAALKVANENRGALEKTLQEINYFITNN